MFNSAIKIEINPNVVSDAKIEPLFSWNAKCHKCLDKNVFIK